MTRPASIRARLLWWSGGLTLVALVAAWAAMSAVLADFVTRRLATDLVAAARSIMAVAEWDDLGAFSVLPPPADPRFDVPLSGWYWQVSDGAAVLARAPSLAGRTLGAGDPKGEALIRQAENFTAPGDARMLTVTVTLPASEAEAEIAAIRRPLALTLAALGLGLMLAQALAVRAGLADLTAFARAVALVRDGRSTRLPPARAAELVPLGAELDRLIAANRAQVDRARAHAGDLAHALKTPLAVLANRADGADGALISRMEQMIRWHLRRAGAAQAGLDPSARSPVAAVLADIGLVLRPEAARRGVTLGIEARESADFRGDAEDLAEMVGALAENAVQWAASRVQLSACTEAGQLVIEVVDDGPGIPEADCMPLMQRGARLDETTQGHGLGLAIAADRASLYGGTLTLADTAGGGLSARLVLPATPGGGN